MIKLLKDGKNLIELCKENNYNDFCRRYDKEFEISSDIDFDIVQLENIQNLKIYLLFILYKQKDNYDISYINWLAKNNYTEEIIDFFEGIISDEATISNNDEVNCTDFLETISKQKNIKLFKYCYDNNIKRLNEQKDLELLIPAFLFQGFLEGLDYLKNVKDFKLMVIDELVYQLAQPKKESDVFNWVVYFHVLKIENKTKFKNIIETYIQGCKKSIIRNSTIVATRPRESTSVLMNSTCGIEPVRGIQSSNLYYNMLSGQSGSVTPKNNLNFNKLKAKLKKQSSICYEKDNVAQSLLNKYLMEISLSEKTNFKVNLIKI